MRRLASACAGASACYVVASKASAVAGRPALVFRYDFEATPPPGVGLLGSVAHTSLARALHVASSCGLAMREAVT